MGQIYDFQFQLGLQNCLAIPLLVHSNDCWFDGPDLCNGVSKLSPLVSCTYFWCLRRALHTHTYLWIYELQSSSCVTLVLLSYFSFYFPSPASLGAYRHFTAATCHPEMLSGKPLLKVLGTFHPWRVRMIWSCHWRRASWPAVVRDS